MKTKRKNKRLRLSGKRRARLPKPRFHEKDDKGFSLRTIEEADGRFSLVKRMRQRLNRLMDDAAIDSVQKEMLAGRAIFLCSYLESLEVQLVEGKSINMPRYIQAVNGLSGTLSRLGIEKQMKKEINSLDAYFAKKGRK